MIEVPTKPKAGLNVSRVAISLNSAAEFSMQFSVVGWGKYTDPEGNEVWGNSPLVSTLLRVVLRKTRRLLRRNQKHRQSKHRLKKKLPSDWRERWDDWERTQST